MPQELAEALERHREQAVERERAADQWSEEGLVFTNRLGGPVHPRIDHDSWPSRAVMGWSQASTTTRYQHVTSGLTLSIAN